MLAAVKGWHGYVVVNNCNVTVQIKIISANVR